RAAATEAHGRLVETPSENGLHRWQAAEGLDDLVRGVRLGEEVEIADGLLAPAVGAGRNDPFDVEHAEEALADVVDEDLRLVQEQAALATLQARDALEDELLRPLREALEVADAAALGGDAQLVDGLHAELAV